MQELSLQKHAGSTAEVTGTTELYTVIILKYRILIEFYSNPFTKNINYGV